MSLGWTEDLKKISNQVEALRFYNVSFLHSRKFAKYIDDINLRFNEFQQIMLMGHFDNAFTDIVEEIYPGFRKRCEMRVLSHRFNKGDKDDANRRALETLSDLGVEVKVNVDAHARMFIGSNEKPRLSELLLGSFDFNRDGLSRRKANAGIITRNPDLIREASNFFEKIWSKKDSKPLKEYIT